MPYVNIQITKGATKEQKAALVKDVTDSLVRVSTSDVGRIEKKFGRRSSARE